jgi:cytochrome c oxidase assembly protein subunit 15
MRRLAHGLALVTAAVTFVLILFGGLVTNTGAALAVPDWPTTFGQNMFLYPWANMVGGIFYEHSHRLIGALVGLLTLALGIALWPSRLRWLGVAAVAAVIVQGVLGGLRVVLLQGTLAILHGCLAQAFFGLLVAIALLSARTPAPSLRELPPATRALTVGTAALVYAQIVFGALLTHAGRVDLHLAGALGVFVLAPIVTARLRRSDDPVAAWAARALLILLGVQLLLGVGAFIGRFTSLPLPGGAVMGLTLPVAHRLAGSLILGAVVVLALRASPLGAVSRDMGGPDMASDSVSEGGYAPLGLPRPQRSEHPGEAVALLETLRPAPSAGAPRPVVASRGTR